MSISLERLIRFNSPSEKLERVYKEIILKHSIKPKINSRNFWNYKLSEINFLFQHIWNESVKNLIKNEETDYGLNLYLAFEEMKEFSCAEFIKNLMFSGKLGYYKPTNCSIEDITSNSEECLAEIKKTFEHAGFLKFNFLDNEDDFSELEKLYISYKMSFPINIQGFLNLQKKRGNFSENVKRLMYIENIIKEQALSLQDSNLKEKLENIYSQAKKYRQQNSCLYPTEMILLAEGTTEEILLPVFSKVAGIDFQKNGIKIFSSGGKNQMLKLYKKLYSEVNLPIFMIFDSDAAEEIEPLNNELRSIDNIYVISKGEFEDILPDGLICKSVNTHYRLTGKIEKSDLENSDKKSQTLAELWKKKGFGEFKKAEFARLVAKNIEKQSDMSEELGLIFEKIKEKVTGQPMSS